MPVVTPATGGVSHNSDYGGVSVVKHGRALVFAIDPSTKELRVLLGEAKEAGGKKKGVSCLGGGRGEAKEAEDKKGVPSGDAEAPAEDAEDKKGVPSGDAEAPAEEVEDKKGVPSGDAEAPAKEKEEAGKHEPEVLQTLAAAGH